jgi:ferric-dicitrate binding protein FerR (iron transport regulator)
MTAPRYARLIAEVWKRGERRASEMPAHSNRDEEIALIEQAMDHKRRMSRRVRQVVCCSLAATALLVGGGMWRIHRERITSPAAATNAAQPRDVTGGAAPIAIAIASGSGSIVAAPGSATPAFAGRALHAGSRLIVDPSAGATLSLSTGTRLEVDHGTELTVVEDGRAQVFALNAGSLRADVAKLSDSERFLVRTVDAEVEVRGTSFVVSVVAVDPQCGGGSTTRVMVYEGLVAVRSRGHEDLLRTGERWPRGCRTTAAIALPQAASKRAHKGDAPIAAPSLVPRPADVQPLATPAPSQARAAAERPPSSTLAEENNLFAEGMLAHRSGKLPLALDKMDRFLDKYPTSHLAENAAVERMRLLRALDPPKATAAARQYLKRYPGGFARADAEAVLAGTR